MNLRNAKSIALYLVCFTDISWLLMDILCGKAHLKK